jgi:hypothetical protein
VYIVITILQVKNIRFIEIQDLLLYKNLFVNEVKMVLCVIIYFPNVPLLLSFYCLQQIVQFLSLRKFHRNGPGIFMQILDLYSLLGDSNVDLKGALIKVFAQNCFQGSCQNTAS